MIKVYIKYMISKGGKKNHHSTKETIIHECLTINLDGRCIFSTRSSPAWSYTRGRSPSAWGQSGPEHPGCQTPRGRSDGRRGGEQRDTRPGRRHCSCGVSRP